MKITKFTIHQISDEWDVIRQGLIKAASTMFKPSAKILRETLCRLLREEMQCWVIHNDENEIFGHMLTVIETNASIDAKELLVYSVCLTCTLPDRDAYEAIDSGIVSFARAEGCGRITAHSANENLISILKKFGYSDDCRVLIKEV